MIDISHKFSTLRYAKAGGTLSAAPETIQQVQARTVPKGDVLAVARAAGIQAAKRCADWMVFCHSIPLDWVDFSFNVRDAHIDVFCEARTVWKTGVEMEALSGVSGALLNMYDMLKPLDKDLSFGDIKVIEKKEARATTGTLSGNHSAQRCWLSRTLPLPENARTAPARSSRRFWKASR